MRTDVSGLCPSRFPQHELPHRWTDFDPGYDFHETKQGIPLTMCYNGCQVGMPQFRPSTSSTQAVRAPVLPKWKGWAGWLETGEKGVGETAPE